MNRFSLNGTRAFVTGANTGIGQAIAVDLAQAGAHVIAVGRSSMDDTLAKVAEAGGKADAVLAASIFHFGYYTVGDVKSYLGSRGVAVRPGFT